MENILIACSYDQLNINNKIFNLNSLGDSFWVRIPKNLTKYNLFQIYDISGKLPREVNIFGRIHQDHEHPWIQLPLDILDVKSGLHTYKLDFLNPFSYDKETIFIRYTSQDDNPETPYVYMKDRKNPNHEANIWKDGKYADEYFEQLNRSIEATYGYNPETYSTYTNEEYCSHCTSYNCDNCPHGIRRQ